MLKKRTILDKDGVKENLVALGYAPTEDGLRNCTMQHVTVFGTTVTELAKRLGMGKHTLKMRMKKWGIKNPTGPGGSNNPYGCYGKEGKRRSRDKGIQFKGD